MREYNTTIIGEKKRPQFHDESGAPAPLSQTGGNNTIESSNSRAGGNLMQVKTPPKVRAPAATKKKTVVKTKSRSPTRIQRKMVKGSHK